VNRSCPRAGCANPIGEGLIVCAGDFTALAGMCRGKKRLGEPQASAIQARDGGRAYRCELCRQWHNGNLPARLEELTTVAQATVSALRDDPRVGWRGVLQLADAWMPPNVNRSRWAQGLDQREAMTAP
jgi:hypothetical protein